MPRRSQPERRRASGVPTLPGPLRPWADGSGSAQQTASPAHHRFGPRAPGRVIGPTAFVPERSGNSGSLTFGSRPSKKRRGQNIQKFHRCPSQIGRHCDFFLHLLVESAAGFWAQDKMRFRQEAPQRKIDLGRTLGLSGCQFLAASVGWRRWEGAESHIIT